MYSPDLRSGWGIHVVQEIDAVTTTSTIFSPSLAGRRRKTQSVETTSRRTAPLVVTVSSRQGSSTLILVINYETCEGLAAMSPLVEAEKVENPKFK
ncbi:hypothetical protein F0562_000530 [Nyssa sinensis]|uniref:Uncharacterized protein n=1 Tax=Nyssa sinensis TaxID=561372 RepID=A0A5J5C1N7_9ASTE|nr:hypothetical protein F0562_000530 [Nyssa sinensis]